MNKHINYISSSITRWPYLLLLFVSILASCKKDKEAASVTQVPSLTASTNTVVLSRNLESQNAITFSWSAASVSGMDGSITYFLQWDRKGNNFANPASIKIGKDSLKTTLTHNGLNNLLSTLPADVATPIEIRVVGATSDGSVAPFYSNALSLTVTPYSNVVPPPYNQLWMVGDATPAGWNIDGPTPMTQDSTDPWVFIYTGPLTAGEFKIPTGKSWDAQFYRPVTNHPDISDSRVQLSAGDPDNKWQIPTAGNYKVTLNLHTITIKIVKL
jgi:hypothetical protein